MRMVGGYSIGQLERFVDFFDDLSELRNIISSPQIDRRGGRRLSLLLRKILINGTASSCGQEFGKRIRILSTPELPSDEILHSSKAVFSYAPTISWKGASLSNLLIVKGPRVPELNWGEGGKLISIEKFLSQRVMAWGPFSVRRCDTISYVANKMGGAHFDDKRSENLQNIIDHIRDRVSLFMEDCEFGIHIALENSLPNGSTRKLLIFNDSHLDIAMMDLYATGAHFLSSDSILELEECVKSALR